MKRLGLATIALVLLGTFAPTPAAAVPNTNPIIVIFMENHERSSIVNNPDASYLNSFLAQGRNFTGYDAVTHPSLPNYLAVASGWTGGKDGTDSITAGEIPGNTLWKQMSRNRMPWGVYMESMPSACYPDSSSGLYQLKHNPATPFFSVFSKAKRCAYVRPFSQFDTSALPWVSFISPNMCNDMHDCSVKTGDDWLKAHVPAMLAAGAEVVITFDEGSSSVGGGGNVYCVAVGPGITPHTNNQAYSHYSLLAALEARLDLPKLKAASTAPVLPI